MPSLGVVSHAVVLIVVHMLLLPRAGKCDETSLADGTRQRVQSALKSELTSTESLDFKIQLSSVRGDLALVGVETKERSDPKIPGVVDFYSINLKTGAKAKVESGLFQTKILKSFDLSPSVSRVVIQFDNCSECEAKHFVGLFQLDSMRMEVTRVKGADGRPVEIFIGGDPEPIADGKRNVFDCAFGFLSDAPEAFFARCLTMESSAKGRKIVADVAESCDLSAEKPASSPVGKDRSNQLLSVVCGGSKTNRTACNPTGGAKTER